MNKQELIRKIEIHIETTEESIENFNLPQYVIDLLDKDNALLKQATDLLRELEGEPTDIDDRKYSVKEIKEALLKQMFLMSHDNGYPSMAVPKATILSLGQLMRGAPDLPQPPKTEK